MGIKIIKQIVNNIVIIIDMFYNIYVEVGY